MSGLLQRIQASEEEARQAFEDGVCLPLFLYDHSGLSLSTNGNVYPFNDRWDAGQIGYIYITNEKICKEYSVKRISKKLKAKVIQLLNGEIETYNDYLSGNVYGFVISNVTVCNHGDEHEDHEDSCYGFYGSDFDTNGIWDHVRNKEDWIKQ